MVCARSRKAAISSAGSVRARHGPVDFVKILSRVPRDAYFALLDRARKWHTPIAGHVPDSVSVSEAAESHQKSMEHLFGMLMACSSEEVQLQNARKEALEKGDQAAYSKVQERTLDTFDRKRAEALFARLALYENWQVPTLTMLQRMYLLDLDEIVANPRLEYVSPEIRKGWEDPRKDAKDLPQSLRDSAARQYKMLADLLPAMQKAGVKILAGSDTGDPYTYPGYELHRELELLVQAGLTPLQALQSATIQPAKYLDADESMGTVAAGKNADLVLLEADPLADIRNTQQISAVILGGKYISKQQLSGMLTRVKVRK